jgi:preprotein translocase SecE subunit
VTKENIILLIWVVAIAGIFGFLWWQGYLVRFRDYILETREELKKCTWPSTDELKGSTAVVMISILVLGLFTVGADFIIALMVRWMVQV